MLPTLQNCLFSNRQTLAVKVPMFRLKKKTQMLVKPHVLMAQPLKTRCENQDVTRRELVLMGVLVTIVPL